MKTIISTLFLALIFNISNAQTNKIDGALAGFLRTPFMQKFKDLKTESETTVKHFKQIQHQFPQMEVRKVERGYMMTADRANGLLKSIIQDFSNPKTMKGISKFPESYAKGLELDIYQLSDFYAQNFQQPLADVTGNQLDGSPILIVLAQLVGMTKNMVEHINQTRIANKRYSEGYLRQNLYEPYRFKTWQEIGGGGFNDQNWNQNNDWNNNSGFDNSGNWDNNNSNWDDQNWNNNGGNNDDWNNNDWNNQNQNNGNWDNNNWNNSNNNDWNNQNQNNNNWDNNWNQNGGNNDNWNNSGNNNWNQNSNQNNNNWNLNQGNNTNPNNDWSNPGNPNLIKKDSTKQTQKKGNNPWDFTPKKKGDGNGKKNF